MNRCKKIAILVCVFVTALNIDACGQEKAEESNAQTDKSTDTEMTTEETTERITQAFLLLQSKDRSHRERM